ncbi:hypothetical protein ACFYQA_23945 [Streptomyces sp. NPDC005774]|uniref:hypothetical protein n=1 Tax=Streptomyces sp. NPDC005774 TaxID=3364728 RepID=UPI0036C516E0
MSGRPEPERSDWTDLDLLTREEAYGRLREEIAATEAHLAELGDLGSDSGFDADSGSDAHPDPGQAERELIETRLSALREAADALTDNTRN